MPAKTQIEHIMTFIKVVELTSFSAAADNLSISKSVVSNHVSALEESLQCRLLTRSTRKLSLTDVGLTFYNSVKSIPDLICTAENTLQNYSEKPQGTLKVIAPMNLSHSLKNEIVPQFLQECPDVTLQLSMVRDAKSYSGNFDILIMWKLEHDTFPDYPLIAKRLLKLPIGLFASPKYLATHGTPHVPEDLLNHNCFSAADLAWPFTHPDGKVTHLHVHGNLQTSNDDIIHSAVCADVGIAYSYSYFFMDSLREGRVVPVLGEYTQMNIEVYAFYLPGAYVPLKISRFLAKMQDYYLNIQNGLL